MPSFRTVNVRLVVAPPCSTEPKSVPSVALGVVSACAPSGLTPSLSTSGASVGRTFTFALSGDASVLDPWNVLDDNSLQVTQGTALPVSAKTPLG